MASITRGKAHAATPFSLFWRFRFAVVLLMASSVLLLHWRSMTDVVVVVGSSPITTSNPLGIHKHQNEPVETTSVQYDSRREVHHPRGKEEPVWLQVSNDTKTPTTPHEEPKIPRTIVFTHKTNLLDRQTADPATGARFLENILNTILVYQQQEAWSNQTVQVWFLDDHECERVLQRVYPHLVRFYRSEENGSFKGDICRVAALYLSGGYYFDVDIKPIEAVRLSKGTVFSTVIMLDHHAYFQAFIASVAGNPILYDSLGILVRYYAKEHNEVELLKEVRRNHTILTAGTAYTNMKTGLIGPWSLKAAYEHVTRSREWEEDEVVFLAEELLHPIEKRKKFPRLQYQDDGRGCCCHYVVHDGIRPYFFSRFVGAGEFCHDPDDPDFGSTPRERTKEMLAKEEATRQLVWDKLSTLQREKKISLLRLEDLP